MSKPGDALFQSGSELKLLADAIAGLREVVGNASVGLQT
jgi:hypothetical protein